MRWAGGGVFLGFGCLFTMVKRSILYEGKPILTFIFHCEAVFIFSGHTSYIFIEVGYSQNEPKIMLEM